jgi:hypothetical protein
VNQAVVLHRGTAVCFHVNSQAQTRDLRMRIKAKTASSVFLYSIQITSETKRRPVAMLCRPHVVTRCEDETEIVRDALFAPYPYTDRSFPPHTPRATRSCLTHVSAQCL